MDEPRLEDMINDQRLFQVLLFGTRYRAREELYKVELPMEFFIHKFDESLENPQQLNQVLKDHVLSIMAELVEFLDHLNWKMHKPEHPLDREKMLVEFVDIMKYVINLFIYAKIDLKEFVKIWNEKSKVNYDRLMQDFRQ